MIKKEKVQRLIKPIICGICLLLTGCSAVGLAQEATFDSAYENGEEDVPVNIYTSEGAVLVENINEAGQSITVYMIDRNESRTFSYDNATMVQDKFGGAMSMAQLSPGEIADVAYNSELEKLGSITLSADAWSQEGISKYDINAGSGNITIGNETYDISGNLHVYSQGNIIDLTQIISEDILTIRGKGHTILSIMVDNGHGYLDLVNEEAFLGGWIEIGQAVISEIAPDMLLTVPEGSYTVRLTVAGIEEIREVVVERNKEAIIDLGDVEIPQPEDGRVLFEILPKDAVISIDGERVDTNAYAIRVPFGLHQVTAEASGYDTLTEYFQVEGETTVVKMELEEAATVSGNGSSFKKEQSTVTIDTPMDVEVYQDNLYMGISPVTYFKTPGSHTITLRRTGYITRSYTIQIPDDNQDVTYSFPDLDREDGGLLNSNTVSGNAVNTPTSTPTNTVSGNSISGNTVSGNSTENVNE